MEKVSVIVPIYNVEKYLKYSIGGILKQSYKNLEIILVNDGSQDNSLAICEEYSKIDNRIKIISVENGGQGRARNIGLQHSTSDWILFLDADDYYDNNAVEYLVELAERYGSDLVVTPLRVVRDHIQGGNASSIKNEKILNLNKDRLIEEMYYGRLLGATPCGKLYKREILEKWPFPDQLFEDLAIAYKHLMSAKKVAVSNQYYYNYYQRVGSTTKSRYTSKLEDFYRAIEKNYKYLEEDFPNNKELSIALKTRMFAGGFQVVNSMIESGMTKEVKDKSLEYRKDLLMIIFNSRITKNHKIKHILFSINPKLYTFVLKKYITNK
ncbi:glycosyl transferase family 2 protein [Streptococcus pneumoniae]|uniref:glycosyltransferase family 2 protein n=1 Tax=Streptococcus pneumoniae TaxID=1313 RepID=UPI0005E04E90|nr:glycosyltransferase family 2 protein [Streptococcus pneumoniae]MDS2230246.1 glycosyltransferase family 2 protein [Streptococcus pneumoniae]MDS2389229.1 glycosyltransferase family 2 protein [Streptococcus pneumoniae]MDS2396969.1 glycosyltransferase family 2 protein [Streptococcus pneumoniae]MDS2433620.1 glycosyltransferase family 2 protein [Streptococcus pneumoniae]MDS2469290.1 glycosyltransferase family 2 protein [Streptococcus pneumoniae]